MDIKECRFCGNKELDIIKRFKDCPLSGQFIKEKQNIKYEKIYPLTLLYCYQCNTCLIKEIIPSQYLFENIMESSYFYYSSAIKQLVIHFKELYETIKIKYPTKKILEIGCNDGVFINNFIDQDYNIIGVDPSKTILNITNKNIITYHDYFNDNIVVDIINMGIKILLYVVIV